MDIPGWIASNSIAVFILFAIVVALLYKLFRLALSTAIAAAAGAAFPWIIKYLKLNIPVQANIESSLLFAGLAAALFLGWTFLHWLVFMLKIITWPLRWLVATAQKRKLKRMEDEFEELRKRQLRA